MGVRWRWWGRGKGRKQEKTEQGKRARLHEGKAKRVLYDLMHAHVSVCSHTSPISDLLEKKCPSITQGLSIFQSFSRQADEETELVVLVYQLILDLLRQNQPEVCLKSHLPEPHCRLPESESGVGDVFCPEWASSASGGHRAKLLGPKATRGLLGTWPGLAPWAASF